MFLIKYFDTDWYEHKAGSWHMLYMCTYTDNYERNLLSFDRMKRNKEDMESLAMRDFAFIITITIFKFDTFVDNHIKLFVDVFIIYLIQLLSLLKLK